MVAAFLCVTSLRAQHRLPSPMHEMFASGIGLTFKQEYIRADSVAAGLAEMFPRHPIGALLALGVLQAQRMDFELEVDEPRWDSLIRIAIIHSKEEIDRDARSLWGRYFLGVALGYDAYKRSETGEWLGAISKGMTSAAEFESVLLDDSLFFDADLGLGTYKYWKSRKTEFLQWLPFITDERGLGTEMLKRAITLGEYSRAPSIVSLAWIYLDAANFDEAEITARRGLQDYPSNRQLLWILASAQMEAGRFADAETTCRQLIDGYNAVGLAHPFFEIVWRKNLAECLHRQHKESFASNELLKIYSARDSTFPRAMQVRAQEILGSVKKSIVQRQSGVH